MKGLREEYEKEHPERIGETDKEFARENYLEWLESKNIALQERVKELEEELEASQDGHRLANQNYRELKSLLNKKR